MRSTIMFRALITLAAAAPSVISAQAVEVTPFLGAFLPVSELLVEDEFSGRHSTGFAGGLRLAYQTGSALGFAASTTYAVSDFEVEDEGERLTGSGHVMAVSGTARYRFPAGTSRVRPHIAAGIAMLMRGGEFYDEFEWEGATDVGAVIGAGAELSIGERLRLSVEIEDFISSASVSEGSLTSQSRLQNDVALSIGVVIPIWSHR